MNSPAAVLELYMTTGHYIAILILIMVVLSSVFSMIVVYKLSEYVSRDGVIPQKALFRIIPTYRMVLPKFMGGCMRAFALVVIFGALLFLLLGAIEISRFISVMSTTAQ